MKGEITLNGNYISIFDVGNVRISFCELETVYLNFGELRFPVIKTPCKCRRLALFN